MTVKEFKNTKMYKEAEQVNYYDTNDKNISYKPIFILNLLQVIGTSCNADDSINVDVLYID